MSAGAASASIGAATLLGRLSARWRGSHRPPIDFLGLANPRHGETAGARGV